LLAASPPGVRIVDYGIRGMHLAYDLLDGYRALILLDLIGHAGVGEVRVLEVRAGDLTGGSVDAHGMDPAAVLGTLQALGGSLPPTYVVGCAPQSVADGIGLSGPVGEAVAEAVVAVWALLDGVLAPGDRAAADPAVAPQ
jgi:hydrogenase maturation protease